MARAIQRARTQGMPEQMFASNGKNKSEITRKEDNLSVCNTIANMIQANEERQKIAAA